MPARKTSAQATIADPMPIAVPVPEDLPTLPLTAQPDDNPNGGDPSDPEGPTPAENPDEQEDDVDADNQDEDADADAGDDAEKQAEAPSELPAGEAPAGQPGPAPAETAPEPAADPAQTPAAAREIHTGTVRYPDRPPAGTVRYEARIQILDAYQYPGGLSPASKPGGAPDWVDRNWVGYADPDELRQIPAGPCLRVPLPVGLIAICRIGDYVCRQSVLLAPGLPADVRLEVWQREQFEKMFVPRPPLEFRPFNPPPLPQEPAATEPKAKPAAKAVRSSRGSKPAPARASRAA